MIDVIDIPSPCFVLNEKLLIKNLEILAHVQKKAQCKIICALKGYAFKSSFPLVKQYLPGTTASSLNEALLAEEHFGGEIHTYAPAYQPDEIDALLKASSCITFNSLSQLYTYKDKALAAGVSIGIRINPEYSEVDHEIYNPCATGSRFGITLTQLENADLSNVDGLHFHALCEQGADTLERVLQHVEKKFGSLLNTMKWLNMGGGHHITRDGYDCTLLIQLINTIKEKYEVDVILEPGEAIGLNTGYLISTVLDIVDNEFNTAMIDASFAAHMPDCLEMPYYPEIEDALHFGPHYSNISSKAQNIYRLAGTTCMAGDYLGFYSFNKPLSVGDRIIFKDMIHYTMVKTNHFNGVTHPSIGVLTQSGEFTLVTSFGYASYASRL